MLATALIQASSAFAGVDQVSAAEQSWSHEWASQSCADSSRIQEVSSPAAQGRKAYELTVRDGDDSYGERCELGQGNPGRAGFPVFHDGDETWMSFQVYLPDDYPIDTPRWNVFFQIHQQGDGGCPPISLNVEDGQFKLYNSARNTYVSDTREKWSAPAQRNRWIKFTVHMKNSTDDGVGFVELYGDLDGRGQRMVMPREYMHTMTIGRDGRPMTNHARIGIYRNPDIEGTSSIYFDGFTIASDQASAEASAFGPADPGPDSSGQDPGGADQGGDEDDGARGHHGSRRGHRGGHGRHRVVLRSKRRRGVHSSGRWPRTVAVYGWVKTHGRVGRRSVEIQIRRRGHWRWLSRGWLRRSGRFYLAPSVDVGIARRVKLRAHVQGVGYSKPITARV